ncbi:hypothetical protein R3X25_02340 [Lutibacter sp. TH_r2]|uniref:hypothetical protein n=1 Tax=Lutibacter sp. TH_r2 TaxID=3082083 RepID=UPI002953CCBA|nr:hypothetical protein [Lutibacter sp. TH_r2]MDV7186108.1 hypothetical protein [Lutibacter sp. TH_r2]
MKEKEILLKLQQEYPVVNKLYPFPDPFIGDSEIKAIVLGADPSHIVNETPKPLKKVFQLDNPTSPYWRSIQQNINQLNGLTIDNLYVQNLCRNYFNKETSKNTDWIEIARNYWSPFLKIELDVAFDKSIPILMTTEFILNSVLKDPNQKIKAKNIYTNCISIAPEDNLLGRELIALYRHFHYSLKKDEWSEYNKFINRKL